MTQLWSIFGASDEVLCPSYPTPSFGSHPKDNGWAWSTGQRATRIDAAPDPLADEWDGSAWVKSLTFFRAQRIEAVKARRDQAEWGGCATAFGRVDSDPDSQRKVVGADRMAEKLGEAFSVAWTMQDNSSVVHDAVAMGAMALAVGIHVATCHAVGQAKRAAIAAAETVAAVEAVDLEEGWPDA